MPAGVLRKATSTEADRSTLIVLLGATGVGKTALSLELGERLGTTVISADSRQIYRELPIGTAAPTEQDLARVPHYLIGSHSITDMYSAGQYEIDALGYIMQTHRQQPYALLSGGSMMYIDAICRGIDAIPDVLPEVRQSVYERYERQGLQPILDELARLDPIYYAQVDKRNYKRVLHGLEVCLSSGQPFSSFRTGQAKPRPFRILKLGLKRPRAELYERINERVLEMMRLGLEEEARAVYPYRHLNALNTVGYKELFRYFDGKITREEAIRQIQKNSRVYARKQEAWWQRDQDIYWIPPEISSAVDYLREQGIDL